MRTSSGNKIRVPLPRKPRWAVLISGRGSNLASLLDNRSLSIEIVISSRADAEGCLKARRAGVRCEVVPLNEKNKIDYMALTCRLENLGITNILLAGYMKIVPKSFVNTWRGRIFNLHPSMLPLYPGLNSIETAYRDRADLGITVHEVNEDVDAGQIIAQKIVIKSGSTSATAADFAEFLVHVSEQRLLNRTIPRLGRFLEAI